MPNENPKTNLDSPVNSNAAAALDQLINNIKGKKVRWAAVFEPYRDCCATFYVSERWKGLERRIDLSLSHSDYYGLGKPSSWHKQSADVAIHILKLDYWCSLKPPKMIKGGPYDGLVRTHEFSEKIIYRAKGSGSNRKYDLACKVGDDQECYNVDNFAVSILRGSINIIADTFAKQQHFLPSDIYLPREVEEVTTFRKRPIHRTQLINNVNPNVWDIGIGLMDYYPEGNIFGDPSIRNRDIHPSVLSAYKNLKKQVIALAEKSVLAYVNDAARETALYLGLAAKAVNQSRKNI